MKPSEPISANGPVINRLLLTGAARRSVWPVLAALFGLGMTIAVGVIWPVILWLWVWPANPELGRKLATLLILGWAWMGFIWAAFFRAAPERRDRS